MNKTLVRYGLFAILILVFCFSCNKPQSILEIRCQEHHLKHIPINIDNSKLFKLNKLVIVDSMLIAFNESDNYYFSVFNINTNKLMFQFGKKGKGPGEIQWPIYANYNQNIHAFEIKAIQPQGAIHYNIDSLVYYSGNYNPNCKKINIKDLFFYNLKRLNDSLYIGITDSPKGQFTILDDNLELISIQERFPVQDETIEKDQTILASVYQGNIMTHPEQAKFVYTPSAGSIIEFCEIDEQINLKKIKSHYFSYLRLSTDGSRSAKRSDNIFGYNSLYTTKKYIYALYSDATILDYIRDAYLFNIILVFDWDGNLVKKYHTDINLRYITISSDDKIIYGTTANPEPQIVKFKIKM